MTLGEFATIVGATPRWVQNARAILSVRTRYAIEDAKRLGLTRVLAEATGMPLTRAYRAAADALGAWPGAHEWSEENGDGSVRVVVDVERYLSGFAARLSRSRNYYAERQRGRPAVRVRDAVEAARKYGVDITLLQENLKLTPGELLRRNDENVRFLKGLRFVAP